MDCLIIKKENLNQIFDNHKIWEIRGAFTKKRGKIGLIESGSGKVMGTCNLVECYGPLDKKELLKNKQKHKVFDVNSISYKKIYAWVIKDPKRYLHPKSYKHPQGAIIWVKL